VAPRGRSRQAARRKCKRGPSRCPTTHPDKGGEVDTSWLFNACGQELFGGGVEAAVVSSGAAAVALNTMADRRLAHALTCAPTRRSSSATPERRQGEGARAGAREGGCGGWARWWSAAAAAAADADAACLSAEPPAARHRSRGAPGSLRIQPAHNARGLLVATASCTMSRRADDVGAWVRAAAALRRSTRSSGMRRTTASTCMRCGARRWRGAPRQPQGAPRDVDHSLTDELRCAGATGRRERAWLSVSCKERAQRASKQAGVSRGSWQRAAGCVRPACVHDELARADEPTHRSNPHSYLCPCAAPGACARALRCRCGRMAAPRAQRGRLR
jgi:hypothetical protein